MHTDIWMTIDDAKRSQVRAHARSEGEADYHGRAADVARGFEAQEWAWPLDGADDAYISAVGVGHICAMVRVPVDRWEAISDDWCAAFREGYIAAHEAAS